MDRFARGEKLRLSDQRQNYKQRIQEIWRRQIASLSADAGNELAARSDLGSGSSAKDKEDTDVGSDAEKEKEDGSDSSDEDDDFLMEMEMDMANTGEANRLMKEQVGAHGSSELSKDAREFAALQRQREEERAMQEGLKGSALGMGDKPKKKFKVVRRKIIKVRTVCYSASLNPCCYANIFSLSCLFFRLDQMEHKQSRLNSLSIVIK